MKEGLSYRDVLLVPKKTQVNSRKEISTRTKLTNSIELTIPIVSANMDTVTEAEMAITLASLGGIGVIHRFNTLEEQVRLVKKVKRHENILIDSPYTVKKNNTIKEIRSYAKKVGLDGFLVVSEENILEGICSARDYAFIQDETILVQDVMTPREKLIVSPKSLTIAEAEEIFHQYKIEKLPVVDENGKLLGLMTSKDCKRSKTHPWSAKDKKGRLLVGAAIGVKSDFLERSAALVDAGCDVLVVDIAHGHSVHAIEVIQKLKQHFPLVGIIAGNVATPEGTEDLIKAGADAIKVGVGPGSMCSTRIVTGSGVPQFTAVSECAKAAATYNIPIIADGGIKESGDIVKALAAGASTVMIGGLLAGTEESPGIFITKNNMKFKLYRGMASVGAALSKLRVDNQTEADLNEITPEGVEKLVPFKGSARDIIKKLIGGLLSGISYSGGTSIKELQENAEFIKITGAGWEESIPHGQKED